MSSTDAGPASGLDAATNPADGGDDASRTGSDGGLSCSMTPGGCLCFSDQPDPGQLQTCSASSVVRNSGEEGVCCSSGVTCQCDSYVCKSDPALSYCGCSTAFVVAMFPVQGASVSACPPPAANQHCCFARHDNSCVCSRLACDPDVSVEMPGCSVATVAACASGDETVASCK